MTVEDCILLAIPPHTNDRLKHSLQLIVNITSMAPIKPNYKSVISEAKEYIAVKLHGQTV